MAFLILLTFGAAALLALGAAHAAERHRRWTEALAVRRRRRVADALAALEHDLWEATGELPPPGPRPERYSLGRPGQAPPRRIVLRVKE